MIRIAQIQDELLHLVGWEQSYDPQKQIDAALTESESGLTFQQAHPMVTLDNLRSIMPEDYYYQYPQYDAATGTEKALSKLSGKVWKTSRIIRGQHTAEDSEYWQVYDFVSVWERLTLGNNRCQQFLTQKSLLREQTLLERELFDMLAD